MLAADYFQCGLESIDHQTDGLLKKDIVAIVDDVVKAPSKNTVGVFVDRKAALDKVIFDRTGLKTSVLLIDTDGFIAASRSPRINRRHPLLTDSQQRNTTIDPSTLLNATEGVVRGKVDKKRGKVTGVFSEIPVEVILSKGVFSAGILTSSEIAAIIIHELGHPFTSFEYFASTVRTNYVLNQSFRRLTQTDDRKKKMDIVLDVQKALDIDIENKEALIRTNNEMTYQTVVLQQATAKQHSELNSSHRDATAWEQLSDQFASRHGAGRDIVTGLDKLHRLSNDKVYMGGFRYHINEMAKVAKLVIGTGVVFSPFAFLYILTLGDPNFDLYDAPKERFERVRRDLLDSLKDRSRDKDYVQKVTEDIELIDEILSEMTDRRTYLQFLWSTLSKKGRHNYQQTKFQQELEILTNNEIFARAAKLRTLNL